MTNNRYGIATPHNITKFKGLIVQPNSFNAAPGSLEKAENVIVKYANMIDKRRGFKDYHQFLTVDNVNNIFTFDNANFAVSATKLFQFKDSPTTAQCFVYIGSSIINVNKRNHGLTNNTFIAEFNLPDSDPVTTVFPSRQSAFYGSQQISDSFIATGSRLTGVISTTVINHGLQNGDIITITDAGSLSVTLGSKTVAVTGTNTFTFSDSGINSLGNFTFTNLHAFKITVAQNTTGNATSGVTAVTYRYYITQAGIGFSSIIVGKTRYIGTDYSGYFTSDQGLLKLDKATNPYYRAGIPEGLDIEMFAAKRSDGFAIGPLQGNKQISYRVTFAKKDANNILVLGAPSAMAVLASVPVNTTTLSVAGGTHVVTVTSNGHGLKALDKIYLSSVIATGGTITDNTEFTVTTVATNSFTFDLDEQSLAAITAITSLNFSYDMSVKLIASIPTELTTSHIIQIFRTNPSVDLDTTPDPRYYKIYEAQLETIDITRGFLYFYDQQPSLLLSGSEELYTNYSLEGESQAANRPPRAKDIALFKGHLFYLNFDTIQTLDLNLVNTNSIANGDTLTIVGQIYKFAYNSSGTALGNSLQNQVAVTTSGTTATVTSNYAFTAGDTIYVIENTLGIPEGLYTIATSGVANFTFATTVGAGTGTITFEGRKDGVGNNLIQLVQANAVYSLGEALDATARNIVKAINRNPSSSVYAVYASLIDNRPGILRLLNKNIEDAAFTISSTSTGAFVPELNAPSVTSQNTEAKGEIMFSKVGEPEAVPYLNRLPVGSKNFEGFRIAALRDSLIIIKQDGVFRLNGNSASNFSVTILDNTTLCKSKESVSVLNNTVFMFSNKGIVSASDSAVEILSREIEPLLTSITGYNYIEQVTTGVAYETERMYLLSTVLPVTALNTTLRNSDVVYAYNYITNAWTTWNYPFSKGFNNPVEDKLYFISNNGEQIYQERKQQSRLDYGDSQYAVPLRRCIISEAITKTSDPSIEATALFPHGLTIGDIITVSYANPALISTFTGTSDVEGLKVVTDILSDYTFTFNANNPAAGLVVSDLYYNVGILELSCTIDTSAGTRTVTITTPTAHNLVAGNNIYVNSASSSVLTTITNEWYLKGTRTVGTTPTPTTFTIIMGVAASATVTGSVVITDNSQNFEYCTGLVKSGLQPQVGDMLYSAPMIYRVVQTILFDSTHYCLQLGNPLQNISDTLSYLYSTYVASIKFTPISMNNLGVSKRFTEFHASFRNSDACSGCNISFSSDTVQSSTQIEWNARVGTDGDTISFNKWGYSTWGAFAWNQGITIARQYGTAPCIHLRTYIPRECAIATFIQPAIIHNVAGEPFSLQEIALHVTKGSNKSTR